MMTDEQLYRAAVRDDDKGEIVYYRGTLPGILKLLSRSHGGVLDIDPSKKVFVVPATHRLPWEIPEEEQTDSNLISNLEERQ